MQVDDMSYLFRKLKREDIPAIAEIASQMPHYFQNILEYAEQLMDDPSCYYYGLFQEENLLGVGNLRSKTPKFAWIESIRVAPNNQQKGIGTALFNHGVEKAKEENYPVVAYATEASNHSSCKIGKKLGFQLVTWMKPLWIKPAEVSIDKEKALKHQPITIDKAIELMKIIPDGPKEEICIGWSYTPIKRSFFANQPDMQFYAYDNTLLLEYKERDLKTNEISFIKVMVYGSEKHVEELLYEFIRRNDSHEYLNCIIGEKLEHIPKEMGFEPLTTNKGKPIKVLLWKLKLD